MNLLADKSIEREVVKRLRAAGHATVYVAELSPSITDDQVLDEVNARSALLVTADKDFGELVYRLGRGRRFFPFPSARAPFMMEDDAHPEPCCHALRSSG
jgi:predicted nuclease of predicted toxin-antitoxin system